MRFRSLATAALLVAPAAATQTRSVLSIYPELPGIDARGQPAPRSTSFTARGSATGDQVEVLAELPPDMFSYVGGTDATTCTMTTYVMQIQDEDFGTQEVFTGLMRDRDRQTCGPDISAPNGFFAFTAALPRLSGGGALLVSIGFPNLPNFPGPIAMPCSSEFFLGARLPANAGWPTSSDGLSIHVADYTAGLLGDHPRQSAPGLGWSVVGPPAGTPAMHCWVWNFGIGVPTPTMQLGGDDPQTTRYVSGTVGFGAGGIYPDISRTGRWDGLSMRVEDNTLAGGQFVGLLGMSSVFPAVTFPAVVGPFSLDPNGFLDVGSTTLVFDPARSTATGVISIVAPQVVQLAFMGTTHPFLAVTVDPAMTIFRVTNSASVSF